VQGVTRLSTVLVGFAVQYEGRQTGQLTNASQQQNTPVLVAQFCASVTWLSTVLVGFALQYEGTQTRQLTTANQQQSRLVLVAQRHYFILTSPTRATNKHTDSADSSNVPCLQMQGRLAEGRTVSYINQAAAT